MHARQRPDRDVTDPIRVLVVDDDAGFADLAISHLEREIPSLTGHAVTTGTAALETLEQEPVDCVVSDYQMPEMDGLALFEAIREDRPDLPFLLFTGHEGIASDAVSAGVTDYVRKGASEQYALLATRIRNAVERYRARTALAEREERFRRLFERSTDFVAVVDESGRFSYLAPSVTGVLGYSPAALEGETAVDYVHSDDHEQVADAAASALEDEAATVSIRVRAADGEWRYVEGTVRDLLDAPTVEGFVVNGRDVTDRIERERVLETVPDGVYVTDSEGRYVEVNDRIEEVTGYDRETLVGSHASMLIPDEALGELEAAVADLLRGDDRDRNFARIEHPVETADGETVLVEARLALRPTGPDDEFRGTIGIARDVTERIVREWQLERQNERLEEFTEVVSHDLRNPLTVADGYLDLARETADPEADAHLERVEASHERMEALISDLLALSRSGKAVQEPVSVTLTKVSQDAWTTTATADATLSVDSSTVLRADADRLHQLLENLFRNAVEHGSANPRSQAHEDAVEHGSTSPRSETRGDAVEHGDDVQVWVGLLEDDDGFYVADDGPGIPDADRENVFEHGYTTAEEGTGLGLSIVRRIAEAHGWDVRVTESADGGARFEITDVELA